MKNKKNDAEVDTLFQKGAIRKYSYDKTLFVSNLFLLPKKSGESRPVMPLNGFVKYLHFKMETIQSFTDFLRSKDFIATINFKDAILQSQCTETIINTYVFGGMGIMNLLFYPLDCHRHRGFSLRL